MSKKYSIKEGVVFKPYGERSLLTNDKLTDSLAEHFISKDPSLLGSVFIKSEDKTTASTSGTKKNKKNK